MAKANSKSRAQSGKSQRDDRYQFQPFYVKAWRWLRYRPISIAKYFWWLLRWSLRGCPVETEDDGFSDTRWQTIQIYWDVTLGSAQCQMNHVWTMDEVRRDLELEEESDKLLKHEHRYHSTTCMDSAAKKMGRASLHSFYVFQSDAINYLTKFGRLTIEQTDPDGFLVRIDSDSDVWKFPDCHVSSGGDSITEALCGAVHALSPAQPPEPGTHGN